jgi:hypothetical protein
MKKDLNVFRLLLAGPVNPCHCEVLKDFLCGSIAETIKLHIERDFLVDSKKTENFFMFVHKEHGTM